MEAPKPKLKYQKSKTMDLSEYIFDKPKMSSMQQIKFDKFDKPNNDDLYYMAENNRIRLTLAKFDDGDPQKSPPLNTGQQYNRESCQLKLPEVSTVRKTKSILKSPSHMHERSICFDERVDVISIDSSPSHDNCPSMISTRLSPPSPESLNFLSIPGNQRRTIDLDYILTNYLFNFSINKLFF